MKFTMRRLFVIAFAALPTAAVALEPGDYVCGNFNGRILESRAFSVDAEGFYRGRSGTIGRVQDDGQFVNFTGGSIAGKRALVLHDGALKMGPRIVCSLDAPLQPAPPTREENPLTDSEAEMAPPPAKWIRIQPGTLPDPRITIIDGH